MIDGPAALLRDIEHADTAVVEADGQQMRVFGVDVEAHDAAVRAVHVLGVAGVLERVDHDHAVRLLHKVVCVGYKKREIISE